MLFSNDILGSLGRYNLFHFHIEENVHTEVIIQGVAEAELSVKAQMVKGETTKGDMLKGEMTKGEMVKGEMVKGEMVKGEMVKGEMVNGKRRLID